MISMEEVTVPLAFTVVWIRMCCLPSDPSEPWTMTFSALVVVAFLGFVISLRDSARWPLKLAWVGVVGEEGARPGLGAVLRGGAAPRVRGGAHARQYDRQRPGPARTGVRC